MLENIPITDLTNYKNEIHNKIVVMYSREGYADISDLLYECIQDYNIIPNDIKASKTKIKSFRLLLDGHTYILVLDAAYDSTTNLNWK